MKRFFILLVALCALPGAAGPLTVRAEVNRASFDLLDAVNVTISVQNHTKALVTTTYADSDTYDIRLLTPGRKVMWAWSDAHKATPVRRTLSFAPGRNVLVIHVWDGTLGDGRAIAPGDYTLHANLSDERYRPTVEIPIRFEAPVPVEAARKVPLNSEVTVSGTVRYTQTGAELADASGAIVLSRRIAMPAPQGTYVVRGFVTKSNDQTILTVERFARTYENVAVAGPTWLQGDFGGPHAAMHAQPQGGTMQFDCAHAAFGAVTYADATHAHAQGTFTREHGGPVRQGETLPSTPATFTFEHRLDGSVAVSVAPSPGPGATYVVRAGAVPQLFRCL